MAYEFFDNLTGKSDSLKPIRRVIGIRRQGNGNFAATMFAEWADGTKGNSDIGVNFRTAHEAKAFASEQAPTYGGCKVALLPSARAA